MIRDQLQFGYKYDAVNSLFSDESKYKKLNSIDNWRQILSTLWDGEVILCGTETFRSYEHGFQYFKYKVTGHDDDAYMFCLESNSKLSKGTGNDALAARKQTILSKPELQMWRQELPRIKRNLMTAKFAEGSLARTVLLSTGNAELWCSDTGNLVRYSALENLRKKIRRQNKQLKLESDHSDIL